jgi:dimethylaniline monooxygenase (N-oxide forming)
VDIEVSEHVAVEPGALYDMVSDVTRMGEWSPECYRCKWIGGASGPAVGARFIGFNRRGWVHWVTIPKVTVADQGREFAFRVPQSDAEWSYRFESDGEGTRLTETRRMLRKHSALRDRLVGLALGADRDGQVREGMQQTLRRIKAAAEGGTPEEADRG